MRDRECHPRRFPFPLVTLFVCSIIGLALTWGGSFSELTSRIDILRGRADRIAANAEKAHAQIQQVESRVSSLDAHLADSVRISHSRRADLATELRREIAAAVASIPTPTEPARPEVTREDIARLTAAGLLANDAINRLADVDRAIFGRLEAIETRLKAIETRKPPVKVVERVETVRVEIPTPVYVPVVPVRCR